MNIWRFKKMKRYRYSEQDAVDYAKEAAKTVEIRSFTKDSCSVDTKRESTTEERVLLENAICAALLAVRNGYDADGAKATAEFFVIHGGGNTGNGNAERITHINSYGSVYIPICEFLRREEAVV
jgi:hypothetical protein